MYYHRYNNSVDKVTISKEVAEDFECFVEFFGDTERAITMFARLQQGDPSLESSYDFFKRKFPNISNLSLLEFVKIVVLGYEIEENI